jgi:hypothetical protein
MGTRRHDNWPVWRRIAFYLAWVYGHLVFALACSGRRESWQWTDVVSLATAQTERISQLIGRLGS